MKKQNLLIALIGFFLSTVSLSAQTVDAYNGPSEEGQMRLSLLDPSRFTLNHSVSFGMASSSQWSGLKSQSIYSTMMTYKISNPLTLNLNFSLPIHSTFSDNMNLTANNIQSLDYFKSIPFDATLSWQPSEKFQMKLSIARYPETNYSVFSPYNSPFYRSPFFMKENE